MTLIIDIIFKNTSKIVAMLRLLIVAAVFTVLMQHSRESIEAFGFS